LARRDAWAWFRGILTHSVKVKNFEVIFGFEKLKKHFSFILAMVQGTLVNVMGQMA